MKLQTVVALLACAHLLPTTVSGGMRDQFNYQHPSQQSFNDFAVFSANGYQQTFTVGIDGVLSGIELFIYRRPTAVGTASFTVRSVDQLGVPAANALIVELALDITSLPSNIPFADVPVPPTLFDLSSYNIRVKPGQVYSVGLERNSSGAAEQWLVWSTGNPLQAGLPGYGGGTIYGRQFGGSNWIESFPGYGLDMEFATYVSPVPEPGAILLTLLGSAAGCWWRRASPT